MDWQAEKQAGSSQARCSSSLLLSYKEASCCCWCPGMQFLLSPSLVLRKTHVVVVVVNLPHRDTEIPAERRTTQRREERENYLLPLSSSSSSNRLFLARPSGLTNGFKSLGHTMTISSPTTDEKLKKKTLLRLSFYLGF